MSASAIELPLFPLDVVLFPGTVMPLHIFEPRYRQMIEDCLQEEKPFGLVLARPESEHLQEQPYTVGTMAEISNLDRLEDGRYTLMAVGLKRFRILESHREKPYLSGIVLPYDDKVELDTELASPMEQANQLFSQYMEILLEAENSHDLLEHLPENAESLSYFVAYFLDVQDEWKQHCLEMTSTKQRLLEEITILRREVPFMRQILTKKMPDEQVLLN